MSTKRCKIHYRRLRRDNGQFPNETLSIAIGRALGVTVNQKRIDETVMNRIADVPRAEGYKRALNNSYVTDNYVFGDLCLFAPGQMQALLQLSSDVDNPSLDEVMKAWEIAERKAPKGHEYLHGLSYWLAIGDHFYQIQHVSVQAKAMEEYLTWLLRDQAGVIGDKQYVELQGEFDRDQVGGDLEEVRSIEIGGLVPETVKHPESSTKAKGSVVSYEAHEKLADRLAAKWGKARKIIEELLGEPAADKLLATVPADAALEVTVNIGYRAIRRKFSKEFMGNLAAGLRNAPDGEVRIRGKDGEIKGDDARLSLEMNIRKMSENSGLLDMEHACAQILEIHRRFLHDGKITETNS